MADASTQGNAPPDKYSLVYLTFLIHGMAILLPWNMFITAIAYFTQFKLGKEYIGEDFPYVANFMQILTFSSQVPNVFFNWFNIFVPLKGELTLRIMWSILVNILLFIITVMLAMVDTSDWPYGFFYITMISVIVLNMSTGIYQNTVFGMAAKLPPQYTGAIILGNNICGLFATVVSICSHYVSTNAKMAAIWYFITALFMLLIGFDTYFALPLNRFYRYYDIKDKKQKEQTKSTAAVSTEKPPYLSIVKQALPQLCNVFLVFLVTLAVFPAIHADIKVSDKNFFIQDPFLYTQILCFLTFNLFATLGSTLPSFVIWPSQNFLWIPVTLRLLYIPFYLFCNYQPLGEQRVLSVLINNDYVYWLVATTMGFTNGYFSSLAMMYAPGTVSPEHASVAGMFAGAFLISGIFTGIVLTFIWPWLVTHVG